VDLDWDNITCATIDVSADDDTMIVIEEGRYYPRRKNDGIETATSRSNSSNSRNDDETSSTSTSPPPLLQQLLFPLEMTTFLDHCFRSCAVHAKCRRRRREDDEKEQVGQRNNSSTTNNNNNRYQSLIDDWLFGLDPRQIYQETSSESIFVWLQQQPPPTETTAGRTIHSIEVPDAETAYRLYEAGHATYCRAPPALEQILVQALLVDTGLGCGQCDPTGHRTMSLGRGEVEVFISRTAGHITNWHYDFQENFTLQLSGIKRWTVQKSTICHPLRGCTPHYHTAPAVVESQLLAARLADPSFTFGPPATGTTAVGPVEIIELQPGDCLYFPAGMWHKIEVIEPGVSINISLMATNFASVTCQAIEHLLLQRAEWRECLLQGGGPLSSSTVVVDRLQSLLATLPDIVRDFAATHGAGAILPPCTQLQQPPNEDRVVTGTDDESMEADDDEKADDQISDDHEKLEDEDDGQEDDEVLEEDEALEADEMLEEEDEEPPLAVSAFAASFMKMSLALRQEYCLAHRLVVNPLAALLREEQDILRPCNGLADPVQGSTYPAPHCTFLLNVNFAGNEGHESLVRQRFVVDGESLLPDLLQQLNENDGSLAEGAVSSMDIVRLVDFLVHFGYLQWQKK
jgi:Cupin superfamily protein